MDAETGASRRGHEADASIIWHLRRERQGRQGHRLHTEIRQHSTWEGEGPDRTNMEAITVAPDGSAVYGGEAGLRMVVKFVKNK